MKRKALVNELPSYPSDNFKSRVLLASRSQGTVQFKAPRKLYVCCYVEHNNPSMGKYHRPLTPLKFNDKSILIELS